MQLAEIYLRLLEQFGAEKILGLDTTARDPWINIAPAAIREVCQYLRDLPETEFDTINDLCGVDYLETDAKKKDAPAPHLEVVYHLYSYTHKHACKLKLSLSRWQDDIPGRLPQVPSVSAVWAIADWHEREAFDLVGIEFTDHPNLRRILCPEDWVGHPLRKDYDFPLEYHGIRGR